MSDPVPPERPPFKLAVCDERGRMVALDHIAEGEAVAIDLETPSQAAERILRDVDSPSSDPLADLRRWSAEIAALPEPIAYIVLDHDIAAGHAYDRRDARGKRYVAASPSFLDEAKHTKYAGVNLVGSAIAPLGLFGIPLYRCEDVPDEWMARP